MQQAEKSVAVNAEADDLMRKIADMDCVTLTYSQVAIVRNALLTGLHSFAEIERTTNEYALATIGYPELKNDVHFLAMRPLHPTGAPDTCGDFAAALSFIEAPRSQF